MFSRLPGGPAQGGAPAQGWCHGCGQRVDRGGRSQQEQLGDLGVLERVGEQPLLSRVPSELEELSCLLVY